MSTALITGAASGTGFGIAERLATDGFGVVVTSRDEGAAETAAVRLAEKHNIRAGGFGLDPKDGEEAVARMFDSLAEAGMAVDTLVLNAANLGLSMDPLDVDLAAWAEVVQTNLVWNFAICRHAARMMQENAGGSIAIIGSTTCRRAIPNRSAYIASKAGLVGLAKALAVDFGQHNVRVNCLVVGSIETERWKTRSDESIRKLLEKIPLGRASTPDDIAEAVLYLARSKQTTGAELVLDGGAEAAFVL